MRTQYKPIITFTGVDENTDLDRLQKLQARYPLAEFGVLLSATRNDDEKERRYPGVDFIRNLKARGLNLSLHLCGAYARLGIEDDFTQVYQKLGDTLRIFKRIQLNIPLSCKYPKIISFNRPTLELEEIIIGHNPQRELPLDELRPSNVDVSFLLDGSGGRGVDCDFVPQPIPGHRTGYAGGVNPENAMKKWHDIKDTGLDNNLWIDMESGVRTDKDWFDLDKVESILKQFFPLN